MNFRSNLLIISALAIGALLYYYLQSDSALDQGSVSVAEPENPEKASKFAIPNRELPRSIAAESSLLKNSDFERSLEGLGL